MKQKKIQLFHGKKRPNMIILFNKKIIVCHYAHRILIKLNELASNKTKIINKILNKKTN